MAAQMMKKANAFRSPGRKAAGMPPVFLSASTTTKGRRIEMRRGKRTVE